MIARYWSARTAAQKAPAYAHHLQTAVFPELKKLDGYSSGMLLQRDVEGAVEVVVITFWKSIDSIRAFSGDDLEQAVVPDKAAALLNDFDRRVRHYEVVIKQ
jgi:heme-degrading monooxygenase HmoA